MTAARSPSGRSLDTEDILARLKEIVGRENLFSSGPQLEAASQDVYRAGNLPLAVVSPASTEEVSRITALVCDSGLSIFVRGGGMSYTDAVVPDRSAAIVLRTDRLDAIREINSDDLYATVEVGCTWSQLDEALAAKGLRAIFWGPMSGRVATVGGAMAQGAVTFGSARHGASVSAAIGLEVVLADGTVLKTGSAAQANHSAFFRDYGPDLTGLFCADSGALGIKTAVTLRLQPRPAEGAGLTFVVEDFERLLRVVQTVSREGYATEIFGAEASLVNVVAGPPDLRKDFRNLLTIVRAAKSPLAGLSAAAQAVVGGRRFLRRTGFLVNFLTEGRDRRELVWNLRRIRASVGSFGVEVANTMAEFTRAMPFPEPAVLGPEGRRLLPLHGVVPYSRAAGLHTAFSEYLESLRAECEQHDVQIYVVFATCGTAGFLYECVIYWKDEWLTLHRQTLSEETLASLDEGSANPQAREFVERIRVEVIELMYRHGCVHYQIGRAYPYTRDRNAAALDILCEIKTRVDPDGRINPGALGLRS